MNFKTAKMMTKYRVCITFMSILLLLFHFVFLFSCGKLPEKHLLFLITCGLTLWNIWLWIRFTGILDMLIPHWMNALSLTKDSDKYYKLLAAKSQIYLQIVYMIPGLFYIGTRSQ